MDTTTERRALHQPDGITCGPTVMKMTADRFGCGQGLSIKNIGDLAGTNAQTGTTDLEMHKGLAGLGMRYTEHNPGSLPLLRECLSRGSDVALRWMYGPMKHWVLAVGDYGDGTFDILDPSMGRRRMTGKELDRFSSGRNWQMFEIHSDQNSAFFLSQRPLGQEWGPAIAIAEDAFEHVSKRDMIKYELMVANPTISPTLWIGETMIAAYFMRPKILLHDAAHLDGIQGLGLALVPPYRGRGYGSMLRAWPARTGIDYVWGAQLRTLCNIEDWKKRRIIFREAPFGYITVESVTQKAKEAIRADIKAYNAKLALKQEKKRVAGERKLKQTSLF